MAGPIPRLLHHWHALLPGFSTLAAHAFIDPFRAANYLGARELYRWPILSLDGGAVASSSGLSIGAVARRIGVSPVHYYFDVRLDRARALVTQTELLVVQVAAARGFGGAVQFTRTYKRRFGLVPSRERREPGTVPVSLVSQSRRALTAPRVSAFPGVAVRWRPL